MSKYLLYVCLFFTFASSLFAFEDKKQDLNSTNLNTNIFENSFVKNDGQWDDDILFVGFSKGITVILKNDGLYIDAYKRENTNLGIIQKGNLIKYNFLGSNLKQGISSVSEGLGESECRNHYLIGSNPSKWKYGVRRFNGIVQKDIYDKIDLKLTYSDGFPRYDFIVHPGADLSKLQIKLDGAEIISNNQKELIFSTSIGSIYNGKLNTYQIIDGKSVAVESNFEFYNNQFKVKVGDYNKNFPLIIDPVVYASYLGGSGKDEATGVVRISDDKFAVLGSTESVNFISTPGAYQTQISGGKDVFLVIYKNLGRFVKAETATFIGGAGDDQGVAIDIDKNGDIYICGNTKSINFPLTSNPMQNTNQGATDGFFAKFDGKKLTPIFMSYIGGKDEDFIKDMCISSTGQIYLVGQTFSDNFPKVGGLNKNTNKGLGDGFVAQINATGIDIGFSNFFGGTGEDVINSVDVDANGDIYTTGSTKSVNIPTVPIPSSGGAADTPFQAANNGGWDAFVTKYNKGGASIYSSTYFGGGADDFGTAVMSNTDGTITFAGHTSKEKETSTFPLKNPYQSQIKGGTEGFYGKLDLIKKVQVWGGSKYSQETIFATYFGGKGNDYVTKLRRNELSGSVLLFGSTTSNDLPIINAEVDKFAGGTDLYLAEFTNNASDITFCTYFGTKGEDIAGDFNFDIDGHYYIVGTTKAKDLQTSLNASQSTFSGGETDALIYKITTSDIDISTPAGGATYCPGQDVNITWAGGNLDKAKGYTVSYYNTAEQTLIPIATDVKTETYKWTIPSSLPPRDDYFITVTHPSGAYDITNNPFKVAEGGKITSFGLTGENAKDSVCEGSTATFKVEATGQDLKYQWRFNGTPLSGKTSNTLQLTNVLPTNSGAYDVVVTGTCTNNLTSDKINFWVRSNPKITTEPVAKIDIYEDDKFELSTAATGSKITYQWQKDGENIVDATANKYSITKAKKSDSGKYKCVVTGACGNPIETAESVVTISTKTSVSDNQIDNSTWKVISSQNSLLINLKEESTGKLYITSTLGNIVELLSTNGSESKEINFDTNRLISGAYWLIWENGDSINTFKFIVTK